MQEAIKNSDLPADSEQTAVAGQVEQNPEKPAILVKQFSIPLSNADAQSNLAKNIAEVEAEGYENYSILNAGMGEGFFFFRLKGCDNA